MKGFAEFKGYRSRVIYDPDSKEFVVRGLGYPDFDVRDPKVLIETLVKPTTEHEVRLVQVEITSERSAKPNKSRASASTHSSAMMES